MVLATDSNPVNPLVPGWTQQTGRGHYRTMTQLIPDGHHQISTLDPAESLYLDTMLWKQGPTTPLVVYVTTPLPHSCCLR